MTGLRGSEFTSQTGAWFTAMPSAVARDRELAERSPAQRARVLLQDDPADLIGERDDRRDAAAAARAGDAATERVEDVLHALVDLVDVERALAQEERDAQLEAI